VVSSFKDNKPFIGTTRYASLAAHKGYELGRKDDLESMMYVLLFFLKGVLPWQNLQNVTDDERTIKVGELKLRIDLAELCKDLPVQFVTIMEYIYWVA
jgi:casein kinase I family protein HRR25